MKKRKVLILKRDQLDFWSAYYQGTIVEVAGGWMKIKEYPWSRGQWIPTVSEMLEVVDIRKTNLGLWRRPDFLENNTKMGFKTEEQVEESKKTKKKKKEE